MKKVSTIISGIIFERTNDISHLEPVLKYCESLKWNMSITPTNLSIEFREDKDLETFQMFDHILHILEISRGILWSAMFYREETTTKLLK